MGSSWELCYGPPPKSELIGVICGSSDYDVVLRVTGDFPTESVRESYCEWLCEALNSITG